MQVVVPTGKEIRVFSSKVQREIKFSVIHNKIIICKTVKEYFPGKACEYPHEIGA